MSANKTGTLIFGLLLCVALATLLGACQSDGVSSLYIAYGEKTTVWIADEYRYNNVYINLDAKMLMCPDGSTVKLPGEATKIGNSDDSEIKFTAEVVCQLGQVKIDGILEILKGEMQ